MRILKQKNISFLSFVMSVSLVFSSAFSSSAATADIKTLGEYEKNNLLQNEYIDINYSEYLNQYSDADRPNSEIVLNAAESTVIAGDGIDIKKDYEAKNGISFLTDENDTLMWDFYVANAGLYILKVDYYPYAGNGGSIQRCLYIDGKVPFSEVSVVEFTRLWANGLDKALIDTQGNEIMIEQVERPAWISQCITDPSGSNSSPLYFYLSKGEHTLALEGIMETMLLQRLVFAPISSVTVEPYSSVEVEYSSFKSAEIDSKITLQGENADLKSSQTLYPSYDNTSPSVEPYSCSKIVYNTIGGSMWSNIGQWVEWNFYVEESGIYNLVSHFKQSFKEESASVRELLIDGKVPFFEASNWTFSYNNVWQTAYFADENNTPYKIYLTEGNHTIRLNVALGKYSQIIFLADECLQNLNYIYRSIISISGAKPDQYRDYKFNESIPDTIDDMRKMSDKLKTLEKEIQNLDNTKNTIVDIKRLYNQLDMMTNDTDTIALRLTNFKDNIASYGTWLNALRGQPLEIDWIAFVSPDEKIVDNKVGFFELCVHYIKIFLSSFTTNYQLIGQTEVSDESSLKVWTNTSQDQAQILRQMISSDFTPDFHIATELQLVSGNSLLPAILANKGPDVSLGMPQSTVYNLALRGALLNLAELEGYSIVKKEFYESSLIPFKFETGVYALPETLTWPMLFYRKDILYELGIDKSELSTWKQILTSVLPKLKKSSLAFGMTPSFASYANFLYQSGGTIYTEDGKYSALNSAQAISSMKLFTSLYKQYGLLLSFDFANRFRNGEIPIAITDFTAYNNLTLFAGEIKGQWSMLPIPGTLNENGEIDNTAMSTVTGTVILSNSDKIKNAWNFVKWWLSADTQDRFGKRLESVVGTSSRYNTANIKAMARVSWEPETRKSMLYQAEHLKEYTEVPGGYFTERLFNFAFRNIVYNNSDVRKSMEQMTNDIDSELLNKRKEYALE